MIRICGLLLAVLMVPGCTGGASESRSEPSSPTSNPTVAGAAGAQGSIVPVAPSGTRYVGLGRVVVAVPHSWDVSGGGLGRADCGEPHDVYFYSEVGGQARCPQSAPAARFLVIAPLDSQLGRDAFGTHADNAFPGWHDAGRPDGVSVAATTFTCEAPHLGYCGQYFAVPSENVFFSVLGVRSRFGDTLRGIRASLRLLPDGYTTVPFIAFGESDAKAERLLRGVGLVPEVPEVNFPHYVVGTEPAAGSVVPDGASVALVVGDG